MALKWWEKTVEYKFVVDAKNFDFAAPLDGNHEAAGDLLSGFSGKLFIIEFKKDMSSCKDELKKFESEVIDQNKDKFSKNFHFLIYGEENTNGKSIDLYFDGYFYLFKPKNKKSSKWNANIFHECEVGIHKDNIQEFDEYIEWLIKIKKNKKGEGSGNGSFSKLGFDEYTNVVGISSDGKAFAINFDNYCRENEILKHLYLDTGQDYENTDGPGMG
ncbi:MAG: hypothetical protein HIU90_14270 [Proteobacteria bacterium]|nr:hypothetical protein [Pseudomonadota bacterium]